MSILTQAQSCTLVKFGATWCSACKQLTPILESIGVPYEEVSIDEEAGMDIAASHNVQSLPTIMLRAKNGTIVPELRLVGIQKKDQILNFVRMYGNENTTETSTKEKGI